MGTIRLSGACLAILLVLSATDPAHCQTLVRDPVSGDYVLTYTDLGGTPHTVHLEARDRVRPEIIVQVTNDSSSITYRYTLTNQPGSPQPIMIMDVPCPRGDVDLTVTSPPAWQGEVEFQDTLGSAVPCEFLFREAPLAGGEVVSDLVIRTRGSPTPTYSAASIASAYPLPSKTLRTLCISWSTRLKAFVPGVAGARSRSWPPPGPQQFWRMSKLASTLWPLTGSRVAPASGSRLPWPALAWETRLSELAKL